jgi:hypothetical protein
MNSERRDSPCPQCDSREVDVTVIGPNRFYCHCRVCGYAWTEPGVRPAKDRRKKPRVE